MKQHKKSKRAKSEKQAAAERQGKLVRFLESDFPGWKDADHPELKNGTAAWVRKLRRGR
jgi:hypothetical protein